MKKTSLLFSFIFFAQFSFSQLNQLQRERLDSLFTILDENNKLQGSVAIMKNGQLLYNIQTGILGKGVSEKPNINTAYRIGSITKMFTAAMIFQLIDEKKLKLSDSLNKFFPKIKNASKITIANMLEHRSGIHNFTDDENYLEYNWQVKTKSEMLALLEKMPSDFEPDAETQYSNSNYVLLGYIIEEITKKSYANEIIFRINKKCDLKLTYQGIEIRNEKNEASSFIYENRKWNPSTETSMTIPGGAGAIESNPLELCKFITSLFQGKLISEASLLEMKKFKDKVGRGVFQMPFYKYIGYGHNGGIDGFVSNVIYFPHDSVSFAITSNAMNTNFNDVLIGMLSIFYNRAYSLPVFSNVVVNENKLIAYEGNYSSTDLPLQINISANGTVLSAQATGQPKIDLDAESETVFKFDRAGLKIIFKKDNENINEFTLEQGGGKFLFKKNKK